MLMIYILIETSNVFFAASIVSRVKLVMKLSKPYSPFMDVDLVRELFLTVAEARKNVWLKFKPILLDFKS